MDASVTQEELLPETVEPFAVEGFAVARSLAHLFSTCTCQSCHHLVTMDELPVKQDLETVLAWRYQFSIKSWLSDAKFQSRLRQLARRTAITLVAFLVIVFLGMNYEQAQMRKLPSTEYLYKTPHVCALTVSYDGSGIRMSTLASTAQVEQGQGRNNSSSSTVVAHCGECGRCSNPHDINIYDQTKTTLYKNSLACAKRSLLGGIDAASRCLSERVGLSNECNECWVENIMCDRRQCVFSCLWESIASRGIHGGSANERLNRCTQCDEVRCGPAFVLCAGANRRRTAIKSDIVRDIQVEVCSSVEPKWWLNQELQTVWQQMNGNITTHHRQRRPSGIRGRRPADYALLWS